MIGFSIWILGDAIHHYYDYVVNNIHSIANIGWLFYTDVFVPIILLILLVLYLKTHPVSDE